MFRNKTGIEGIENLLSEYFGCRSVDLASSDPTAPQSSPLTPTVLKKGQLPSATILFKWQRQEMNKVSE